MSDGLKVLSHFLKSLDQTLKILANRKNDSVLRAIETNIKEIQQRSCGVDKRRIVEFTKKNPNFLQVRDRFRIWVPKNLLFDD